MARTAAGPHTLALVVAATVLVLPCLALPLLAAGTGPAACLLAPPSPGSTAHHWDATQISNAATIVATGASRQIPARGQVIAVATAMQESGLRNQPGGDRDSVGLFQQRPSQGWGTAAQLSDPVYAAGRFYDGLTAVDGWQDMTLTRAAQAVQRSAYPDAYAKWENDAWQLVPQARSADPAADPAGLAPCGTACQTTASPDGQTQPCADAGAAFARASSWLTAWAGGPVPYSMNPDPAALFRTYRRDCSGYVSMALGLPGPGLTTVDLAARATAITKTDLQPGDLMIHPATGGHGHVVLFERWTDASMASYYGYEQSGDSGTHHRQIPYPYFGTYDMAPYRWGPPG